MCGVLGIAKPSAFCAPRFPRDSPCHSTARATRAGRVPQRGGAFPVPPLFQLPRGFTFQISHSLDDPPSSLAFLALPFGTVMGRHKKRGLSPQPRVSQEISPPGRYSEARHVSPSAVQRQRGPGHLLLRSSELLQEQRGGGPSVSAGSFPSPLL